MDARNYFGLSNRQNEKLDIKFDIVNKKKKKNKRELWDTLMNSKDFFITP